MNAWRWTLAVWAALVMLALAWCAVALKVDSDFSAFLPGGQTQVQRIFNRERRDGAASRLLLVEIARDNPVRLAAISRAMVAALSTSPEFRFAANGESTL